MKHPVKLILPAIVLLALLISGCSDETEPQFTRLVINPQCGVVPLEIEGYATVSGGNESGDPTGGNNNLEITWDFDDGTTSSTSISYHVFDKPDVYNVRVTAKDPDGKTTEISLPVTVRADSLWVDATSNLHGDLVNPGEEGLVKTNEDIYFNLYAESCEIDMDVDDHYRNLSFVWHMGDWHDVVVIDEEGEETIISVETVSYTRSPVFSYAIADEYDVTVDVAYPALAVIRHSALHFTVTDP